MCALSQAKVDFVDRSIIKGTDYRDDDMMNEGIRERFESMNETTELEEYTEFVAGCISSPVTELDKQSQIKWAISEMCGEAGEVSSESAKATRKGRDVDLIKLKDELGDTLWGIVATAHLAGISMDEIIEDNIQKLNERRYGKIA